MKDTRQTKETLEQMIQERKNRSDVLRSYEDLKDKEIANNIVQEHEEEQIQKMENEKMRKDMYKQIWNEQAKMNQKAREIDKIFN